MKKDPLLEAGVVGATLACHMSMCGAKPVPGQSVLTPWSEQQTCVARVCISHGPPVSWMCLPPGKKKEKQPPIPGFCSATRFVLSRPEYAHFMNLTKELLMHLMDPWLNSVGGPTGGC